MLFTTGNFIIFMVIMFFLYYYIIPQNKQWCLLLVGSYFFYACASPIYLVFLLFTTIVTYTAAIIMDKNYCRQAKYLETDGKNLSKEEKKEYKTKVSKKQKISIAAVTTVILLMLGIFKYSTFLLRSCSGLFNLFGVSTESITLKFILPVGLSFYVFQSLGYCIDVYRGTSTAEHNFFKYMLYVSFFPQLLQGPIGDYNRLSPQLFKGYEFSTTNVIYGLQRAIWGFFKKLLIANQISTVTGDVWAQYASYNGFLFWLFMLILYAVELYADFSGYMDIAVGCAQMLGITLDENFDAPYFSKSIAVYWRRWHITLGAWFRNYVFYSILRADWCNNIRKKLKKKNSYIANTLPTVIALLIVWLLIGLWHGADWSYVVHGLYHGIFIILSTLLHPFYERFHKRFPKLQNNSLFMLFQIARTFTIVIFGYLIFSPANLLVTTGILKQMFSEFGLMQTLSFGHLQFSRLLIAAVGTILLFITDVLKVKQISIDGILIKQKPWVQFIAFYLFIMIICCFGYFGENQFAYFKF